MSIESRIYRPDIDGLRAIAVLSVVIFHINPEYIPGGFVGVDIFFVISGYLITRNIRDDIIAGTFTYSNFYARRIRRLFPAFFFTLLVTAILGFLLLSPDHFWRLGQSIVYSTVSLSNFYFWSETGYFDVSSSYKPLLHFWSLAVEEQFYLIWPALLLGVVWSRKHWVAIGLLFILGITSLIASMHWMAIDEDAVFYLMPFRMFEFTIGAMCVWVTSIPGRFNVANEFLLICGFGLIVYSFVAYNESTLFPGYGALMPCLGAALVIYSGHAKYGGYILRNKLAVNTGLISYSLYLIHWPLLVYYKYWTFSDISLVEQAGLLVIALLFAAWMYRYIEKPFRYNTSRHNHLKPATLWFRCTTLMALVALPAAHAWANLGWNWRVSSANEAIMEQTRIDNHRDCKSYDTISDYGYSCGFGAKANSEGDFRVVLLGDSHSKHWVPGLHRLFSNNNISAINLGRSGVLPFPGGATYESQSSKSPMLDRNNKIQSYIENIRPNVVILSARWALYANSYYQNHGNDEVRLFAYDNYNSLDKKTSYLATEQALIDLVSRYSALGIHTILLGQVPPLGGSIKDCLTRPGYLTKENSLEACRVFTRNEALDRIRSTNDLLLGVKRRFGDSVSAYLPSEWLCSNGEYCDLFSNNEILYKDDDHISYHGSIALVKRHMSQIVKIVNSFD